MMRHYHGRSPYLQCIDESDKSEHDTKILHPRPVYNVIPKTVAQDRAALEEQHQWRLNRWNQLHYLHLDSLAEELRLRIMILIWTTILLV